MCIYLHAYSLVYIASMASRPRKRKREPLSAGFNPWHQPLCFDQEGRFLGGLGMTWYPQKDEEKRWEEFFGGLGERFLWIKTWCRYYSFWEQPDMKEQRLTVIAEGAKLQTCTYILFWSFLTPCLVAEVFSTRRYNTRIYIYIYLQTPAGTIGPCEMPHTTIHWHWTGFSRDFPYRLERVGWRCRWHEVYIHCSTVHENPGPRMIDAGHQTQILSNFIKSLSQAIWSHV